MEPQSKSSLQPWNFLNKFRSQMWFAIFLLVVSSTVIESHFLVRKLPGFLGDLPFSLETGYIGVGESDDLQLFYYFIESEGNPKDDPLMLWLTGGPSCSGLSALLYEIGPLTIDYANSTLVKTVLKINPYSWTKAANIIFIDQPAGTGFSYAKTLEAYITNDTFSAMWTYHFLRKWLVDHPKFLHNPFYVIGDSYSGIVLPMIVQEVYDGNEVGEGPHINIKGYILGNPFTDTSNDYNSRISYAHSMALLSDAIYKDKNYIYASTWANSRDVREALHIHQELNDIEWVRCNETMKFKFGEEPIAYTHNVLSVVGYHQRLADKNCQALIYSGDHDMKIPYHSTLNWIESLNLSVEKDWRPWFVNEQVGGYTMKFTKHEYILTYATVKGGGHNAPENKPKECLSMLTQWLANNHLEEVTQLQSTSL